MAACVCNADSNVCVSLLYLVSGPLPALRAALHCVLMGWGVLINDLMPPGVPEKGAAGSRECIVYITYIHIFQFRKYSERW